jgi:serine/threonine protein kinase
MAPELIQRHTYNEKVDVWSLGVMTYMLLSGKNPFPGRDKREIQSLIVKSKPDLNKACFKNVSQSAKDFIMGCLNKDVNSRLSAEDCINHKWQVEQETIQEISSENKIEVLSNLQQFSKATKFQKTILSVLLGLRSDKEDLQMLRIAFNKMDKDGDGNLSTKELQ